MNETNKATATRFLQALGSGDTATLKQLITPDIVAVTPGTAAICGTRNYDVIVALPDIFSKITKNGIEFKILHLTAEEDRVAIEAEGYSTMSNGKHYNNRYHFLMFFRDGKICKVMEYLDTKLADEVLAPYLAAAG